MQGTILETKAVWILALRACFVNPEEIKENQNASVLKSGLFTGRYLLGC
jgi:hypothetical protein